MKILLTLFVLLFSFSVFAECSSGDSLKQNLSINKEFADKAAKEVADNTEKNNEGVAKKEIGKVLKVKKGKGFGDNIKLRKKAIVETGVIYKTLAGGNLHLMLDEKTKIFIGYNSEIIIKNFDIVDKKIHKVEIKLVSGSFMYLSLRKTSTYLKVLSDDDIIVSKGCETGVAFIKNDKEIRFVNAGKSELSYEENLIGFRQYAILDPFSKVISINSISNAVGDKLVGTALEDWSMTSTGSSSGNNSGDGGGTAPAAGGYWFSSEYFQ